MQCPPLLDLYFIDARSKLIDIAAFLDRLERSEHAKNLAGDHRVVAFRRALEGLAKQSTASDCNAHPSRAEQVLLAFSDPTTEPVERAGGKGATGAWPGPASPMV